MTPRLIIFGAAGDLAGRYLLPALARLHAAGKLPAGFAVTGVDRPAWDAARFREHMAGRLADRAADLPAVNRDAVLATLDYVAADVTDPAALTALAAGGPAVVYLALPPAVAVAAAKALAGAGLPAGSRVVVEKPFGHDLASARDLNQLLAAGFPESAVYRIDHFLGKQTVQNVLGLRFANRLFEHALNRDQVERVEITWDEVRTVEGRAGYYDRAGALKDMIQNHLLQLLALVAMEAPHALAERDLRDRKADVLRAVRRPSPEEVVRDTVRARYTAGRVRDRDVPDYVREPGVDPARNTETFARATLYVDTWRWAGVPFVLRTGKALARVRREVAVYFRPVPHLAFEDSVPAPNVLRMQFEPDRMTLGVNVNGPGDPFDLEYAELEAELAPDPFSAYGRLLLDILRGEVTFFIRGDEAEESWRVVEPILAAWAAGAVPLREYPAGSAGPAG